MHRRRGIHIAQTAAESGSGVVAGAGADHTQDETQDGEEEDADDKSQAGCLKRSNSTVSLHFNPICLIVLAIY